MKEQDQTIRSLPEGLRRINEAYRLFEAFIRQIKKVESYRVSWATIASLATNPVEDDSDDKAKRSKWVRAGIRTNLALASDRLAELHRKLPEAFAPVLPMLRYSRIPLGKFHFEGSDGNHAYWFIDQLFHRADDWALMVDGALSADLQLPLDPREWEYLSKIDDSFPLPLESEKALLDRLALEESQLQRDLPNYAEILGVKETKPGTVFEITQAIDRAYDLAFSLVSRLRFAESFATQAAELTTVAFFEGGDESDRVAQAIAQAKGKLFDRRSELIELRERIDSDLEELRDAFVGVPIKVFKHSYADTKDFEETGDPSVYASIINLTDAVKRWISETLGFLSLAEQLPAKLDRSLCERCNEIAGGFPMTTKLERAFQKRILKERSILSQNIESFAKNRGIGGSATTTTPENHGKPPKPPKPLSEAEKQITLAAAVWLHYRDLAQAKEIKILKSVVYPVAKDLGFKGTYKEFQRKSNDGGKGPYKEATIRRMKEINFPTETSFLGDL